jgi:hypothetical protein
MPRVTKPKRGWKNSGTFTPFPIKGLLKGERENADNPKRSKDDFDEIADILGIQSLPDVTKKELRDAATDYYAVKHVHGRPTLSEQTAALIDLRKNLKKFLNSYSSLDSVSKEKLLFEGSKIFGKPYSEFEEFFESTIDALQSFENKKVVFCTIEKIKQSPNYGRPGRKPNKIALRILIEKLSVIFSEVTGKEATVTWNDVDEVYGGLFLKFVTHILELTEKDPGERQSESAIAEQVKKVLRTLKK